MDKLLLRPEEAAEVLGISRAKLYDLLGRAILPVVRVGASLRVPVEGLQKWVMEQSGMTKR